jgi:hypothetical protein
MSHPNDICKTCGHAWKTHPYPTVRDCPKCRPKHAKRKLKWIIKRMDSE